MQFVLTVSSFLHIMIRHNVDFCKNETRFKPPIMFQLNCILLLMMKMKKKQFWFNSWKIRAEGRTPLNARLMSVLIAWPKDRSPIIHSWSLTWALITLIPLCNFCDFHVKWRIVSYKENTRCPSNYKELSRLYTHSRYNRCQWSLLLLYIAFIE